MSNALYCFLEKLKFALSNRNVITGKQIVAASFSITAIFPLLMNKTLSNRIKNGML